MSELKGKTVKIGEGRIMFHYGEAEPTDTEYEIVFTIVQCKDCKWWRTDYTKVSPSGYEMPMCVCTRQSDEPYEVIEMQGYDFCSRGEMRTF